MAVTPAFPDSDLSQRQRGATLPVQLARLARPDDCFQTAAEEMVEDQVVQGDGERCQEKGSVLLERLEGCLGL